MYLLSECVCKKWKVGFVRRREEDTKKTCYTLEGGMTMSFYEDMVKSLSEAIEMERGNLLLKEKDNMPAPTFCVEEAENNTNTIEKQ